MTIEEIREKVDLIDGMILDLLEDVSMEIDSSNVATTKELEDIQEELYSAREHLLNILYTGGDNA